MKRLWFFLCGVGFGLMAITATESLIGALAFCAGACLFMVAFLEVIYGP